MAEVKELSWLVQHMEGYKVTLRALDRDDPNGKFKSWTDKQWEDEDAAYTFDGDFVLHLVEKVLYHYSTDTLERSWTTTLFKEDKELAKTLGLDKVYTTECLYYGAARTPEGVPYFEDTYARLEFVKL